MGGGRSEDPVQPLAERLAARLEELGLGDQLAAAGLPTFVRDADGVARWHEAGTDEPLDAVRLAELDRLVRSQGDEPEHAVPVALVRLRRESRVRAALLDGGWLDYAGVGERRGTSVNAARFSLHKAAQRHAVLLVPHEGHTLVPRFQLDDDGQVRAELVPVLEPLLAAGLDPWRIWVWLTTPAALLGGAVPHDAVRDADERALVQHAAIRLAERRRAGSDRDGAHTREGPSHP